MLFLDIIAVGHPIFSIINSTHPEVITTHLIYGILYILYFIFLNWFYSKKVKYFGRQIGTSEWWCIFFYMHLIMNRTLATEVVYHYIFNFEFYGCDIASWFCRRIIGWNSLVRKRDFSDHNVLRLSSTYIISFGNLKLNILLTFATHPTNVLIKCNTFDLIIQWINSLDFLES